MAFLHYIGMLLCIGATAMMVIVSVGVPIWDRIDFVHASGRAILLGVWGLKAPGIDQKARLGYEVLTGNNDSVVVLHKGLSYALVLNPIAAGFAALAALAAIFSNTACGILASLLAFWAFLVTLVALAIDLAAFIMARNRLNNNNPGSGAALGTAMWLVVASTGALLIASLTVCFTHSSHKRRKDRDVETRPLTNEPMTEKRHFWQRRNRHSTSTASDPVYGQPAGTAY